MIRGETLDRRPRGCCHDIRRDISEAAGIEFRSFFVAQRWDEPRLHGPSNRRLGHDRDRA